MASSQSAVVTQLRNIIWHSLDNNLIPTAIFTAERLLAYDPKNQDSIHLLALCFYRDGQFKSAENLTRGLTRHVGCAYVYAQSCYALGKHKEGVSALDRSQSFWMNINNWNSHSDTERRGTPDAAAIHCLVGHMHRAQGDIKKAVESYVSAVQINPFLWEAFTGLCETGVNLKVNTIFKQTEDMKAAIRVSQLKGASDFTISEDAPSVQPYGSPDPFTNGGSIPTIDSHFHQPPPPLSNRLNEETTTAEVETPTAQTTYLNQDQYGQIEYPRAPARKTRAQAAQEQPRKTLSSKSRDNTDQPDKKRAISNTTDGSSSNAAPAAPARRSSRLLGASKITSKFATAQRDLKKPKSATSRSRTHAERPTSMVLAASTDVTMTDAVPRPVSAAPSILRTSSSQSKQEEAQLFILDLLKKIATGCYGLAKYDLRPALSAFHNLPTSQRDTSFILGKIGRVYYEMANYVEAEKQFQRIRQIDPTRLQDMEIYSTLLWHLRKEVELSYLAHELSDLDRLSPQAWCAMGNSFSLQRDYDQALKCFKRASQLDNKLAYAHTLEGHEHIANEEFEKALASYRNALSADPRHYNAWYGMGKVFEKTGKYDMAEKYFRTAVAINPTNSVLLCCVGMVLEKSKNYKGALQQYTKASQIAPTSALSRFKKARVLLALQNFHAALIELQALKDLAPDEANVHFLLGKLYRNLRDKQSAIRHYTAALHLDPKAAPLIKEAIESLDRPDDEGQMGNEESDLYRIIEH